MPNIFRKHKGFTLAEVLITLGIIGVVAAMTTPTLLQSSQEGQMVTGLLKFNSTLQQAIQMWKTDIGCDSSASFCLSQQNLHDCDISNFNQIKKFMKVVKTATGSNSENWLPDDTLNYYGVSDSANYGKVSHVGGADGQFLLEDGTTFSMDVDPDSFDITVDVNGKKPPNRMGKDTFKLVIGGATGKDIYYYPIHTGPNDNGTGLCSAWNVCDAANVDPTVGNGASPTAYVILYHKLPDFKALSKTVPGFRP